MTTTSIVLLTIVATAVVALLAIIAVFWAVGNATKELEPYQDIVYHEAEPPDEKEQIEADIKAFHKGLENGDIIPIIGFKAYKTEDEPNNKEI